MAIGGQIPLCALSIDELAGVLSPLPRFRALQIYKWIAGGALDIGQMTDLPASLRENLKKTFTVCPGSEESRHESKDSLKMVFAFPGEVRVESILLADGKGRLTACLSTQAGCPLGCVFCKTGSLGFIRNLSAAEITGQFLHLRNAARNATHYAAPEKGKNTVANIVVMGMGEPLLNLCETRQALKIITDPKGMNFSKRRITLSTSGISEGIEDLACNGPFVRLALSLVTADEKLRQRLMPGAKNQPLAKIKKALVNFQKAGGGRITLELVLLGGINTRAADAPPIAEFAKGLDTVVNLIPWNPAEGLCFDSRPLIQPEKQETENFARLLEKYGLKVTTRRGKGRGIMGACGQLGVSGKTPSNEGSSNEGYVPYFLNSD